MAFANQNQGSIYPIYPQLIDPRIGNPPFPFFINPNPNNGSFLLLPPPNLAPFLNRADIAWIDEARSRSLLGFMADEGLLPSPEEETKRQKAIDRLREIVMEWIKCVAHQNGVSSQIIKSVSATVLTYGSYGLGVHNSDSDIDALCVGPGFATLEEDFFVVLRNMLSSRPEVSEVHCIKEARVPLMRFKLDGISIDLPYARLKVTFVPEDVDILNPFFLKDIDETSWRSVSGVHANKCILQLVPNLEAFQSLLRCIKLWSKRRGVYGNLLGFFGGIHLAILAAFICERHPNASLAYLVASFFRIFAFWPWPSPVCLQDGLPQMNFSVADFRNFMPIRLPRKPHEYCHSNITKSTLWKIRQELMRGHSLCKEYLTQDFDWACLFETFPYGKMYTRFVKICLSAFDEDGLGEWTGWIKSRFRTLLVKLEQVQGFCDPNPTEYVDINVLDPNVVFYWGLEPGRSGFVDIKSVRDYFVRGIRNNYRGHVGRITMSIVQASQLPKSAQFDIESKTSTKTSSEKLNNNANSKYPKYPNSGGIGL